MESITIRGETDAVRVRVSGPQVDANKRDKGDRPCMYVFVDGTEFVCHEVEFHGETRLVQDFGEGCPVTGAILWLETEHPVTMVTRENRDIVEHRIARRVGGLDDVERKEVK
jgi:hypothetical protein